MGEGGAIGCEEKPAIKRPGEEMIQLFEITPKRSKTQEEQDQDNLNCGNGLNIVCKACVRSLKNNFYLHYYRHLKKVIQRFLPCRWRLLT